MKSEESRTLNLRRACTAALLLAATASVSAAEAQLPTFSATPTRQVDTSAAFWSARLDTISFTTKVRYIRLLEAMLWEYAEDPTLPDGTDLIIDGASFRRWTDAEMRAYVATLEEAIADIESEPTTVLACKDNTTFHRGWVMSWCTVDDMSEAFDECAKQTTALGAVKNATAFLLDGECHIQCHYEHGSMRLDHTYVCMEQQDEDGPDSGRGWL